MFQAMREPFHALDGLLIGQTMSILDLRRLEILDAQGIFPGMQIDYKNEI